MELQTETRVLVLRAALAASGEQVRRVQSARKRVYL